MGTPNYTDDQLTERISRGDWGMDVEPPAIDDVLRLVDQRQRRRRTAIGASVVTGLAAAAAVTAVVGLAPNSPSADVPPADRPTVSKPTAERPTASAPTTPAAPQLADCRDVPGRLLLSQGQYGGTPQRPSQVAVIKNIGREACSLVLPTLSIDNQAWASPVETRPADEGPWTIRPDQALIMTVTAPRPALPCLKTGAGAIARQFNISMGDFTYTLNFPGMRVNNCGAPVLTGVRVGTPPPD